jgi:group I intron endonuclease
MGIIYKITNPKGNLYVGQTVNYEDRLKKYKYLACKNQVKIYNSLLVYGFDSHIFEIVEDNVPVELLNEREIFWVKELKTYYKENRDGLNLNRGGNTPIWDKKRVADFSEKFKGSNNPFYGKTHTIENREKFSKNTKKQLAESGYKLSIESIMKGVEANKVCILVYDSNGDFVSEYASAITFAREISMSPQAINDSLNKGAWVKGKFICKYKTDNYLLKIPIGEVKFKSEKRPVLFISPDFDVIQEFNSCKEASDFFGITYGTIKSAALRNFLKPLKSGHIFIYTDLYAEIEALTA